MRSILSVVIFFCCGLISQAQPLTKVFSETLDQGRGKSISATNTNFCPVSVLLELDLDNMQFSKGQQTVFVIPPRTDSFRLGEVTAIDTRKRYRFSYKTKYVYGDVTRTAYDKNHVYLLPYEQGKNFFINQGYYGNFSHRDVQALDFTMPEGTPVLAAREGVVIKVTQHNIAGCAEESCKEYNNDVLIYHPDGTIGVYAHIKQNGAKVKPGDTVKAGDVIALSGNTGFSSGPHLHFACYLFEFGNKKSVPTHFKTGDGTKTELLKEKQWYLKGY